MNFQETWGISVPLFVHPFLGCYTVSTLAITSRAARTIQVQVFCVDICFQFLFCIYLGVEFLSHMVILCVTVWGTAGDQIYNCWVHPLLLTFCSELMFLRQWQFHTFLVHIADDLSEPGSWAKCGGYQPQARRASSAGIGGDNHALVLPCLSHPSWLKPKDSFLNNVTATRVLGFMLQVAFIGRRVLYHWTTRELPELPILIGKGNGKLLQYSCVENPIDRGAWWAIVHGIARVRRDLETKPPPPILIVLRDLAIFFICVWISIFHKSSTWRAVVVIILDMLHKESHSELWSSSSLMKHYFSSYLSGPWRICLFTLGTTLNLVTIKDCSTLTIRFPKLWASPFSHSTHWSTLLTFLFPGAHIQKSITDYPPSLASLCFLYKLDIIVNCFNPSPSSPCQPFLLN